MKRFKNLKTTVQNSTTASTRRQTSAAGELHGCQVSKMALSDDLSHHILPERLLKCMARFGWHLSRCYSLLLGSYMQLAVQGLEHSKVESFSWIFRGSRIWQRSRLIFQKTVSGHRLIFFWPYSGTFEMLVFTWIFWMVCLDSHSILPSLLLEFVLENNPLYI